MRLLSARSRASSPLIASTTLTLSCRTDLDARAGAPVHRALHERNEDELGDEEREHRARQPKIDMNHVGEHGEQDASLQQGLGNARSDESADRFDFRDDHRGLNPFRLCSGRSAGR